MKGWLVAYLLSSVLGAYAPFPLQIPTIGSGSPMGLAFLNIRGGGYVVGSSASASLGWLSQDGTWTPDVWTENANSSFSAYSTIWSIRWEPQLRNPTLGGSNYYGVLLLTRLDLASNTSAVTFVNPFTWTTVWSYALGPGFAFDADATRYGDVFVTNGLGGVWTFRYETANPPSSSKYASQVLLQPNTTGPLAFGVSGSHLFLSSSLTPHFSLSLQKLPRLPWFHRLFQLQPTTP